MRSERTTKSAREEYFSCSSASGGVVVGDGEGEGEGDGEALVSAWPLTKATQSAATTRSEPRCLPKGLLPGTAGETMAVLRPLIPLLVVVAVGRRLLSSTCARWFERKRALTHVTPLRRF